MFTTDITKNYELQDATFEILIMLAGAFILGALFCWALGKLRGNKQNRKHPYQRKTVDQQNGFRQPIQQAGAIYPDETENPNSPLKDAASTEIINDTATALNTNKLAMAGSAVATNLPDSVTSDNVKTSSNTIASDAIEATGEKTSHTKSAIIKPVNETIAIADDFKNLEGIDEKIETALHAAGIKTYADLRASDNTTLKAILNAASPAFNLHDPETWPYQADLAYNEKWDKLKEYQDFLTGREA
jgi:predicted flap endonuclease-1-like 5' DNA nuclease